MHTVGTNAISKQGIKLILEALDLTHVYNEQGNGLRTIIDHMVNDSRRPQDLMCVGLLYCDGTFSDKFEYLWYVLRSFDQDKDTVSCEVLEGICEYLIYITTYLIPSASPNWDKSKELRLLTSINNHCYADLSCDWLPKGNVSGQYTKEQIYRWMVIDEQFTSKKARQIAFNFAKASKERNMRAMRPSYKKSGDKIPMESSA